VAAAEPRRDVVGGAYYVGPRGSKDAKAIETGGGRGKRDPEKPKAAHVEVGRQPPTTPPAAPNTVPGREAGLVIVVAQGTSQGFGLRRWRWSPIQHRSGWRGLVLRPWRQESLSSARSQRVRRARTPSKWVSARL
jgi:hypothetical protein